MTYCPQVRALARRYLKPEQSVHIPEICVKARSALPRIQWLMSVQKN